MSDYGQADGDGGEYGDGDDWIYVEDYYDQADQLAEGTCPSPAYYEEGRYDDQDDMFDYFADLEYLSDGGYFDNGDPNLPRSRKRKASIQGTTPSKKRRKELTTPRRSNSVWRPVYWMSNAERQTFADWTGPFVKASAAKVGLLKDWKEKFRDRGGLAEFPEDDFEMKASGEEEDSFQDGDEEDEEEVEGEGFDLKDLQQVAGMLTSENLEALQAMMEARGMDPVAVKQVLKDMIEGKERTFKDETDGDEEDEEEDEDISQHEKTSMDDIEDEQESRRNVARVLRRNTEQPPSGLQGGSSTNARSSGTLDSSHEQLNGTSAHGILKRKVRDEDEGNAKSEGPIANESVPNTTRNKKRKPPPEKAKPTPHEDVLATERKILATPRRTRNGTIRK